MVEKVRNKTQNCENRLSEKMGREKTLRFGMFGRKNCEKQKI